MRPRLPGSQRLLPYLQRIDRARVYSNWGELTGELEQRLGARFDLSAECVVTASSGTSALAGAVMACAGRATSARPLAIVPAFTFVATALAVEQCGYRPFLADVDLRTWMLDPQRLADEIDLARVGLVVPVAPFGRPVPQRAWRHFQKRTGVPVVIDGAASFEAVGAAPGRYLGAIPVTMSFHATKTFATGEGGCILCEDARVIAGATRALNFGFLGTRDCGAPSTNGKMSEYHAAVGLAEFDGWKRKQAAFTNIAARYRRQLAAGNLPGRFFGAPDIGGSYALFRCGSTAESAAVQQALRDEGIDFRLWYGLGLQGHTHFARLPREKLAATAALAPCLLGLPMAPDLTAAAVQRIVRAVVAGVAAAASRGA